jgi:hypothetical protein
MIIEAGRVIIEGKRSLPHGKFLQWVENDLAFGRMGLVLAGIFLKVITPPPCLEGNRQMN